MDAPPPQEDVRPFVRIARLIEQAGLPAPRVLACDEAQGFLLLTDLGERTLLDALRNATPAETDAWMREAMALLVRWQTGVDAGALPLAEAPLFEGELALFPTWCVERARGLRLDDPQRQAWARVTRLLVASLSAQPRVAVHADWMARNLMARPGQGLAIIDFQDALGGPIAHDVASMLRDAFISWDEEQELDWAVRYWEAARRAGLPVEADFGEFWRGVEWTGLYRHLRVIGIFCRLQHRDGKAAYAEDLPRFFAYCSKVAMRYRPLAPLVPLLELAGGPALESALTF
jgi:aminoglycoside/choline kinase family phosphotransferase